MALRSGKRPCRICRKWFVADRRVGPRQKACSAADCQRKRREKTQASWRERNADYFIARRLIERAAREETSAPRLPAPLSRLPWDVAQDQFGIQGADFIGVTAKLLHGYVQDQFKAQVVDSIGEASRLQLLPRQDAIPAVSG